MVMLHMLPLARHACLCAPSMPTCVRACVGQLPYGTGGSGAARQGHAHQLERDVRGHHPPGECVKQWRGTCHGNRGSNPDAWSKHSCSESHAAVAAGGVNRHQATTCIFLRTCHDVRKVRYELGCHPSSAAWRRRITGFSWATTSTCFLLRTCHDGTSWFSFICMLHGAAGFCGQQHRRLRGDV